MSTPPAFVHEELLQQAIASFKIRPLLIFGPFGAGKATFVKKFIAAVDQREPDVFWIKIDFNKFPPESFDSSEFPFWKNFVFSIGSQTGGDRARIDRYWEENLVYLAPAQVTLNFLGDVLEELGKEVILVLEGIHKIIDQPFKESFFAILRSPSQEHKTAFDDIKIVASMISDGDEVNDLNEGSVFTNAAEKIQLMPLADGQIALLLGSYGFDDSPPTIERVRRLVGGNLYFMTILLDYVKTAGRSLDEVLATPPVDTVFGDGLRTVGSMISEIRVPPNLMEQDVKDAREILAEFRHQEKISIQSNNLGRIIYEKVARTGILNRESIGLTNINYTLQGDLFRVFI